MPVLQQAGYRKRKRLILKTWWFEFKLWTSKAKVRGDEVMVIMLRCAKISAGHGMLLSELSGHALLAPNRAIPKAYSHGEITAIDGS